MSAGHWTIEGADGCDVREAANGAEALRMLAAADGKIGILVSDIIMPEMGGLELARRVATDFPGSPVLLISGYSDSQELGQSIPTELDLLQKPFSGTGLTAAVAHCPARTLDGDSALQRFLSGRTATQDSRWPTGSIAGCWRSTPLSGRAGTRLRCFSRRRPSDFCSHGQGGHRSGSGLSVSWESRGSARIWASRGWRTEGRACWLGRWSRTPCGLHFGPLSKPRADWVWRDFLELSALLQRECS